MDIEVKSIPRIIVEDVLRFFFIFQFFSLGAWIATESYLLASAIYFMLLISVYGEVSTIYTNLKMLNEMAYFE